MQRVSSSIWMALTSSNEDGLCNEPFNAWVITTALLNFFSLAMSSSVKTFSFFGWFISIEHLTARTAIRVKKMILKNLIFLGFAPHNGHEDADELTLAPHSRQVFKLIFYKFNFYCLKVDKKIKTINFFMVTRN